MNQEQIAFSYMVYNSVATFFNLDIGSAQGTTLGAFTQVYDSTQAGNQLVALQTKQLADLTAVLAAIARAQSLEGARNVESEEQAVAQTNNFLNYGAGYEPGSAQMFH